MQLGVEVEREAATGRVTIAGEIDDSNMHVVMNTISELAQAPIEVIDLDLAAVEYLGSAGVRALIESAELAVGVTVRIVAASSIVHRVLEFTGLAKMVTQPEAEPTGGAL